MNRPIILISLGIVLLPLEINAQALPDSRICGWSVAERQRLGDVDGSLAFTAIGSASLDAREKHILVSQPQEQMVRLVSVNGQDAGSFGREGRGPGEFLTPIAAGFSGDGIWVWDLAAGRLSLLSGSGNFISSEQLGPGGRAAALANGSLVRRARIPSGAGPFNLPLVLTGGLSSRTDGSSADTLDMMRIRAPRLELRIDESAYQTAQPFSDDPLWSVSSDGESIVVVDRRAGGNPGEAEFTVKVWAVAKGGRTYTIPYEAAPFPSARIEEYVQARATRIERGFRARGRGSVNVERLIREALYIPEWEPPVSRLVAGSRGQIWLERPNEGDGDLTRWTVLDMEAGTRCDVDVPADWQIMDAGPSMGLAVIMGPFGVPQLLLFERVS